jgi:hypothetical protein
MLGTETNSNLVPNFIQAASPKLLRDAMLEKNISLQKQVSYFDIQQTKDGQWIAWYYDHFDMFQLIKQAKMKKG